eukprot:scaffold31558_cov39-Tisochrysis_lutea.AAC.1
MPASSIRLVPLLTKWVRARTFVRTKGGTRDAKSSLESLQSLRFPADLRSTDPNRGAPAL